MSRTVAPQVVEMDLGQRAMDFGWLLAAIVQLDSTSYPCFVEPFQIGGVQNVWWFSKAFMRNDKAGTWYRTCGERSIMILLYLSHACSTFQNIQPQNHLPWHRSTNDFNHHCRGTFSCPIFSMMPIWLGNIGAWRRIVRGFVWQALEFWWWTILLDAQVHYERVLSPNHKSHGFNIQGALIWHGGSVPKQHQANYGPFPRLRLDASDVAPELLVKLAIGFSVRLLKMGIWIHGENPQEKHQPIRKPSEIPWAFHVRYRCTGGISGPRLEEAVLMW